MYRKHRIGVLHNMIILK